MGWVVFFGALTAALILFVPGSGNAASCSAGESEETVEVGVVEAIGCFATETDGDKVVYTAKKPVDMNGFIVDPGAKAALQITESQNETEWRVQSIATTTEEKDARVRLRVGDPTADTEQFETGFVELDFRPTVDGPFSIGEYFLGNSFLNGVFGGFSPAQEQTEFILDEEGAGKLVFSLKLTGPFALAGKPQAVSVDFETKVGEKIKLDGFDIELKKMDFFPPVNLEEAKLKYDNAEKEFEAAANVKLPEFGGKGFGGGFSIKEGKLGSVEVSATELEIPIGEVAFLQDIAGSISGLSDGAPDLDVKAGITLGPEVKLPRIGEVPALKFDGEIELNTNAKNGFFGLKGDLALVRIRVARFGLRIYFSGAVAFNAGIGIGIPSFTNDRRQPFYIGAGVDGWVDHKRFSIEGNGEFKLFNIDLLKGNALVSDSAYGACWKVLGIPGGAVYPRTRGKILTFPVGVCGLGRYRERRPRGAAATSADGAVNLADRHGLIRVDGEGGAPRFVMRSGDGREYTTPVGDADGRRSDHVFFIDEEGGQTFVVLKDGTGEWSFEELPGSPPISRVQVNEPAPEPRVAAQVRGRGAKRKLVWSSRSVDFQRQRLEFVERLAGGQKVVIARTRQAAGSKRFKVHRGSHYGKRKLEVLVVHRQSPVMEKVLDTYRVRPPSRPARPARVRAFRNGGRTVVRWAKTRGARRFLVRLKAPGTGAFFTREVSGRSNAVRFEDVPGRRAMVASVRGLNRDGATGPAGRTRLRSDSAAQTPARATRMAVRSANVSRNGTVRVRSHCPEGGHCGFEFVLRRNNGQMLDRIEFQQTPDTRRRHRLFPPRQLRKRLKSGRQVGLKLRVKVTRGDRVWTASARVRRGA